MNESETGFPPFDGDGEGYLRGLCEEESHLYGTIGDFCGLMDTHSPEYVWEKIPLEYSDMLINAIDKCRFQSP